MVQAKQEIYTKWTSKLQYVKSTDNQTAIDTSNVIVINC